MATDREIYNPPTGVRMYTEAELAEAFSKGWKTGYRDGYDAHRRGVNIVMVTNPYDFEDVL